MIHFHKRILPSLVLMLGIVSGETCGFSPSKETEVLNESTFREIWNTIESAFPANPEQQEQWRTVREKYETRMIQAHDHEEFRSIAQEMIVELGLSHFNVLEADPLSERDHLLPSGHTGFTGIELGFAHNQWWVIRVHPGSSAEEAGILPGFRIRSIQGIIPDARERPAAARFRQSRWIWGAAGAEVTIEVLDRENALHKHILHYKPWTGLRSKPMGLTSEIPILYDDSIIDDVVVIRFSNWEPVILSRILQAVRKASAHKGLIIDLRSNTGGIGMMANGLAGRMTDKPFSLGTIFMKKGNLNFAVFPQADPYLGKIAILINEWSASTSEIFALGMKEAGRARVFGSRSMGAALPSFFTKLPNGDTLQHAIATYQSPLGTTIEGSGVCPDQLIEPGFEDLLQGQDPVLYAAVQWINQP